MLIILFGVVILVVGIVIFAVGILFAVLARRMMTYANKKAKEKAALR